jgi:hypothetical protein
VITDPSVWEKVLSFPLGIWGMINKIFTDEERQILEAYLTNAEVDKTALSKLFDQIKKQKGLFEDIFLYLQIRKTITS